MCQHKQLSQHSRRNRNSRWKRIAPLGVILGTCKSVEGSGRSSVVTVEGRVWGGKVSTTLSCAILFPGFCATQSLVITIFTNCIKSISPENSFK